jgi:hypothetical protein
MLSLLSALIPFSAASSTHFCTMECCVGKAPHLAGECSSGLLKDLPQIVDDQPEVFCGLERAGISHLTSARAVIREVADKTANEHAPSCGGGLADTSDQRDETITEKSPPAASIAAASMTAPCSVDCGTVTGGYVRQPRPRDQSMGAWGTRARPPTCSPFPGSYASLTATLSGHYRQPQPRGPPTFLS